MKQRNSTAMPPDTNFWQFLAASSFFGALAAFFQALRRGLTFRRAMLEGVSSIFLCVATGAALTNWARWDQYVVFGAVGLVGTFSAVIFERGERLWSKVFDRAEKEIQD